MSSTVLIKTQNYCQAVRQQLGYPLYAPVNHTLAFAWGGPTDLPKVAELARHATTMQRDMVYAAWDALNTAEPRSIALAIRELHHVDVVTGCVLWAADADSPLVIVAPGRNEHFVLGTRGYFERRPGRPARSLSHGKRIAKLRVRRAAAAMDDELLADNQTVPPGGEWVAPRTTRDGCLARVA